jgi:hypothetical protein
VFCQDGHVRNTDIVRICSHKTIEHVDVEATLAFCTTGALAGTVCSGPLFAVATKSSNLSTSKRDFRMGSADDEVMILRL